MFIRLRGFRYGSIIRFGDMDKHELIECLFVNWNDCGAAFDVGKWNPSEAE